MQIRRMLAFVLAFIVVNLDQATKVGIKFLFEHAPRGARIGPFLDFVEVHNRGVSFGMFNTPGTQQLVMIAIAATICCFMLVWLWQASARLMTIVGIGCVLGGAVGNIIDRATMGYVLDFLSFHVGRYAWPAFNIADSSICIGAFLLIIDGLLADRPKKPARSPTAPGSDGAGKTE